MLSARESEVVREDLVDAYVKNVLDLPDFQGEQLDPARVARFVKKRIYVFVPTPTVLGDDRDHAEWLTQRRGDIDWSSWKRYRRWLQDRRGFAAEVVRKTDDVTDDILGRLEDPQRPGSWDRRGLVAGQVQSGKTANYLGLMCKAVDSGYKLIVVLAGMHDSLRAQTQARIDEGLLGRDSQDRGTIGVGRIPDSNGPAIHSLTTSANDGDFKKSSATAATFELGSDPVVLVVKKNASILRNLLEWATSLSTERPVPLLMIDDEADSASIDTNDKDKDPTTINRLIRTFLKEFDQVAYVGYTATPFANLYIDEGDHPEYGRDLFPRSFIVALRPPSNYIGAGEIFGANAIPEIGKPDRDGLPLVRHLNDTEAWVPERHKKTLIPGPLPPSLIEALHSFLLATAARRARGQNGHNSMLIHVTRFKDVQGLVSDQVEDWLSRRREELRYGSDDSDTWQLLQRLWDQDFDPVTQELGSRADVEIDPDHLAVTWEQVRDEITPAVDSIKVQTVNGDAKEALDYARAEIPVNVIAVGGDKLSRGLTLDGLTVSYYLRASKMYDTLMQMGRWFGYRNDYLDLCRLYTTRELSTWYRDIATASEELWTEFEAMATAGLTPETFGLRVRSHPDGLMVTARTKMRHGEIRRLSYSKTLTESVVYSLKPEDIERHSAALNDLITDIKGHPPDPGVSARSKHHSWQHVEREVVQKFLGELYRGQEEFFDSIPRARPDKIREYIGRVEGDELQKWTVVLVRNTTRNDRDIAGHELGYTTRARFGSPDDKIFRIRRLLDPTHESLDLTESEWQAAMRKTVAAWERRGNSEASKQPTAPKGIFARGERSSERGLLLLYPLIPKEEGSPTTPFVGYGLSLPESPSAPDIEYVVNNQYRLEELDQTDEY